MSETRKKRVEGLLREELSRIIARGRIKDPRLQRMYSVTEVIATKDLKDAKVYVSVLERSESERAARQDVVDALNHAAGYIQQLIGKAVRLRSTPRFQFYLDQAIERGVKLSHRLEDLSS